MHRSFGTLCRLGAFSSILFLAFANPAQAGWKEHHHGNHENHHSGEAPEIDPSLLGSGLTLLGGGMLLITERYRRRS